MIREKGEALSPVKINRNVWSNSASQVKGLFTVCEHLLLTVKVYGLRERLEGVGRAREGQGGRKEERTEGEEEEEGRRSPGEERGNVNTRKKKGARDREAKGERTKELPFKDPKIAP